MLTWQWSPSKPVSSQSQVYSLMPSAQRPPFWHGSGSHSSMFTSQSWPVKPARQVQLYSLTPSRHVALFWHRPQAHSSKSWLQWLPEKPGLQ